MTAPEGRAGGRGVVAAAVVIAGLALAAVAAPALAQTPERYALVITGAAGGNEYAAKYQAWRGRFAQILRDTYGYPADHVTLLGEDLADPAKSTRANVGAALADLRKRTEDGDLTVVFLIGHGTSEGGDAKFNLVGPDMTADEWGSLVKPLRGRVAFINASSGSFPFIPALGGENRVVLTANDSSEQQFETVFPEFFVGAFVDEAGDADKNGKVSLLEAFTFASAKVKDWFEERGRLATERAMIDDTGGGGRDADTPGRDGQLAQVTYLEPEVPANLAGNPELANLIRRRAELENRLDVLRANKADMPADRYNEELERLLLEFVRLDRQLKAKT